MLFRHKLIQTLITSKEVKKKNKKQKINEDEIYLETYKNSLNNFQINSQQAKKIVLESAQIAKFDLLKQRVVILLSLIFCLGFKTNK